MCLWWWMEEDMHSLCSSQPCKSMLDTWSSSVRAVIAQCCLQAQLALLMATRCCLGISVLAPVHRAEILCDNNELWNSSPPPDLSCVLRNWPSSHETRVGTGSRQVSAMTLALTHCEVMTKLRASCQSIHQRILPSIFSSAYARKTGRKWNLG